MAKRKKTLAERCAYCPSVAVTRDHVPSRKFFPMPRPSNLITVPACGKCNRDASDDEEYFLTRVLASAEAAASPASDRLTTERLSGPLPGRRERTILQFFGETELVDVHTEGGLYLGHTRRYPVEVARMNRVIEKIVRGLYYHEYRRRVPVEFGVVPMMTPSATLAKSPAFQVALMAPSRFRGGDVFEYKIAEVTDCPGAAIVLMAFFRGFVALGLVGRVGQFRR